MPDDNIGQPNAKVQEDEEPGRIWRSLKALLFGDSEDNSLRAQLEEVIDLAHMYDMFVKDTQFVVVQPEYDQAQLRMAIGQCHQARNIGRHLFFIQDDHIQLLSVGLV